MKKTTFDRRMLSIHGGVLLVPLFALLIAFWSLPLSASAGDVVPGEDGPRHRPSWDIKGGQPGRVSGLNQRAANPLASPSNPDMAAVQSGPDLIIESIAVSKRTIQRGEIPYARISFLVKNIGDRAASQEKIDVTVLDGGEEREMKVSVQGPLAPGESTSGIFVVGDNEAWSYGSHRLALEVDGQNQIAEVDENNNSSRAISFKVLRVTLPDLVVTDMSVTRKTIQHDSLDLSYVTYEVKNVGNDSVPPGREVVLRYWLDDSPITGHSPSLYGPLEPGESLPIRVAIGYGDRYSIGKHTTQVGVDFGDHIRENNEQNNLSSKVEYEVVKGK